MLIDIHSHLDHCYFKDDLDKVIDNATKADVKVILTAGIDPITNRKALLLAEKYDIVKACCGIYPIQYNNNNKNSSIIKINNINSIKNNEIKSMKNLNNEKSSIKKFDNKEIPFKKNNKKNNDLNIDSEIKFIKKNNKNVIAIGECGLDYFWVKDKIKEQKKLFERMINLAENIKKPIIVHSRKAEQDCIDMLESSKLKNVIMHCFTGKKTLVKKIIDNGWFLTAPTSITRSSQFQDNVKIIPITQIFCETDAPYLTPFKDIRNEPAFIVESYKMIAELKKMELIEVINNIWMNWQKVF